jgi:hypothetical protein
MQAEALNNLIRNNLNILCCVNHDGAFAPKLLLHLIMPPQYVV